MEPRPRRPPAGFTAAQVAGIVLRLRYTPASPSATTPTSAPTTPSPTPPPFTPSLAPASAPPPSPSSPPPALLRNLARTYTADDLAPFVFDLLVRAEKVDAAEENTDLLIQTVCKVKGTDAGMAIFGDIKAENAMNLWEDMKRKQIAPDAMAYNTLIRGFREGGKVERGEELVREMYDGWDGADLRHIRASDQRPLSGGWCRTCACSVR